MLATPETGIVEGASRPVCPFPTSGRSPILEYDGDQSAGEFYLEAAKRVWFCFTLAPEARAALGPSALSLAGSSEADAAAAALVAAEAAEGELLAMYVLGLLTIAGVGVKADLEAGLEWLADAADQGLPEAQYALGDMYMRGELVPGDIAEALDYFELAAEEGYEDARTRIEELRESLATLRTHAEEGHDDAQYRLGVMTWFGRAVDRDEAEGLSWLEAAAAQGHTEARAVLRFVQEELPEMRRMAAAGEPEAQFQLARQFMLDEVLPQDLPVAIDWLKAAARQGHHEARKMLGQATAWQGGLRLLTELRYAAAAGEAWAVEALEHVPAGLGG